MPFTMTPAGVLNSYYTTRIKLQDFMEESIQKVTFLRNTGAAGNMQAFWRAFEATTNAGLLKATQQSNVDISDQSTTIATGHHSKVTDLMVLGFSKAHPVYSTKLLTAKFIIPAPVDAIVNETSGSKGLPVYTRGIDFATAANVNEGLGAMIDFLENALTYTDPDGDFHPGGWTYSDSRSRLFTNSRIIDGIAST